MYAVVTCIIQPFAPQGRQAGARYMPHTHVSTKVRMYTWRETSSQCYPYLLYVVPVAPRKHTRTFSTSRVAKTFSSSLLSSTLRIIPSLQGKDFHGSYTEQYRCHCMGGTSGILSAPTLIKAIVVVGPSHGLLTAYEVQYSLNCYIAETTGLKQGMCTFLG